MGQIFKLKFETLLETLDTFVLLLDVGFLSAPCVFFLSVVSLSLDECCPLNAKLLQLKFFLQFLGYVYCML